MMINQTNLKMRKSLKIWKE